MDDFSSWPDLELPGPCDQLFSSPGSQSPSEKPGLQEEQQPEQEQQHTAVLLRALDCGDINDPQVLSPTPVQVNHVQQPRILAQNLGDQIHPTHHVQLPVSMDHHQRLLHHVPPSLEVNDEAIHSIILDPDNIFLDAVDDTSNTSLPTTSAESAIAADWNEPILMEEYPGFIDSSSAAMTPSLSFLDVESGTACGQLTPTTQHGPNFFFASSRQHRQTLEALRKRVFAIVDEDPSREWARSFVLDTSEHATAQMLTNSCAVPYAVTTSISDTMYEQDGLYNGLFDSTVHINALFVPAFSSGGLTVGVTVNHLERHQGRPRHQEQGGLSLPFVQSCAVMVSDSGKPNVSVGRYVHELASGRLLMIKHLRGEPHVFPALSLVTFLQAVSSTRVEKVNIFCDKEKFVKGRIVDSMNMCVSGFDLRCCPLCTAPPNARCHCRLPVYTPLHAFDFRENQIIKKYFIGDFLGTSRVISRLGITSSTSTSTPLATFGGTRDTPSDPECVYMSVSLMSSMRLDGYSSGDAKHDDMRSMLQMFAFQLSLSDKVSVPARIGPSAVKSNGPVSPSVTEHRRAVEVHARECLDLAPGGHQLTHQVNASDLPSVIDVGCGKATVSDVPKSLGDSDEIIAVSPYTTRDGIVGDSVCAETGGLQQRHGAMENHIGRPNIEVEHGHLMETRETAVVVDERAVRELRRKERNRQAAARSNARRKIRNATLRRELSEMRQALGSLLRRENELRKENLELRRKVHAHLREEVVTSTGLAEMLQLSNVD